MIRELEQTTDQVLYCVLMLPVPSGVGCPCGAELCAQGPPDFVTRYSDLSGDFLAAVSMNVLERFRRDSEAVGFYDLLDESHALGATADFIERSVEIVDVVVF